MVLFAAGHKIATVAATIGCDAKTLRKVYSRECRSADIAALVLRSGMMAALIEKAEAGDVAAIKQFDRMIDAERIRATADRLANRPAREAKPATPGKKQAAKAAADQVAGAGGKFAPPAPPPGLLN